MRVLVTGGTGQLAYAIRLIWADHDLVIPDEPVLDLILWESIQGVVDEEPFVHTRYDPDRVIFEARDWIADRMPFVTVYYEKLIYNLPCFRSNGNRRAALDEGIQPQWQDALMMVDLNIEPSTVMGVNS